MNFIISFFMVIYTSTLRMICYSLIYAFLLRIIVCLLKTNFVKNVTLKVDLIVSLKMRRVHK